MNPDIWVSVARYCSTSDLICISVSTSKTYRRTDNHHPILGVEYAQPEPSLTDEYFAKMGLQARYFMPRGSVSAATSNNRS